MIIIEKKNLLYSVCRGKKSDDTPS